MSETAQPELTTRYTPSEIEAGVYDAWQTAGLLTPAEKGSDKPTFTIMIPPPNVTGVLHMGHALNNTLQDVIARHKRMSGFDTLWVPGTDHAGIATQAVVEKRLFQEKGLTRESMGREAFLSEIWSWKEHHGNVILGQLRRLGASCDWTTRACGPAKSAPERVRSSSRQGPWRADGAGAEHRGGVGTR